MHFHVRDDRFDLLCTLFSVVKFHSINKAYEMKESCRYMCILNSNLLSHMLHSPRISLKPLLEIMYKVRMSGLNQSLPLILSLEKKMLPYFIYVILVATKLLGSLVSNCL